MSKQRHPNECPTCEKIPCQCAGAGGADDSSAKKEGEDTKREVSATNNSVNTAILNSQMILNGDEKAHISLFDEKNQLMRCMLFASTANQLTPASSNQFSEENDRNVTNASVGMGMSMSATDE